MNGPIREPATRAYIWSYCTEHRLFEELRTGHQHHESAVVYRGITPEDATRNDIRIENLSIAFQNVNFLREARSEEKRLSREIYIFQISRPQELHSEHVLSLITQIERVRLRIIQLCDYERFGPVRIRFYDYNYTIYTPTVETTHNNDNSDDSDRSSNGDPNDIFLEYPNQATSQIVDLADDSDKENKDPNNGEFIEGSSRDIEVSTISSTPRAVLETITEETQEQEQI